MRKRRRNGNRLDRYGIYELPEYRPNKKKKKKKKKFHIKNVFRMLFLMVIMVLIVYGVSIGVKYSMYSKGYSLYTSEDYEGAVPLFSESLKPRLPFLEAFDNNVRLYLADCYVNMGEYGHACMQYEHVRSWSKTPDEDVDYLLRVAYGLLLYEGQNYREALPILLDAYEKGYGSLVLYVGSCYGQTGDLENMQLYYNIFLRKNPMNSYMYAQYAAIALDADRLEEAYSYIEQGLQFDDQSSMRELLYDEIVYYEKIKDYNTAYTKAKAFMESYPADMDGKAEYDLLYTRQNVD